MRRQMLIGTAAVLTATALAVPAVAVEGPAASDPVAPAPTSPGAVVDPATVANATADPDPDAAPDAGGRAEREAARREARRERARAQRRADRAARDMVGVQPSLYRGRHFVRRHEPIRRCIVRRESMGYYRVVNRSSGAAGAYQFLRSTSDYVARRMHRRDLVGVPANRWNRLEQDQAFWTLWDRGRGRGHWAGGRWSC